MEKDNSFYLSESKVIECGLIDQTDSFVQEE